MSFRLPSSAFRLPPRGISLIEILFAIGIAIIIFLITTGAFSRFSQTESLLSATRNVLSVLEIARAKTLASEGNSVFGVHFSTTQVVLFQGPTYNPSLATNVVTDLGRGVRISDISLNGGGSDVVFKRLTGETDSWGTVTLLSEGTSTSTVVTISVTGLAKM